MNYETARYLSRLFKALGAPARVQIVKLLCQRALCVGALAARLDMTQSAVSQHLKILRNAEIVTSDKDGTYVHYRLREGVRERLAGALDDVVGDMAELDTRSGDDAEQEGG